MGYLSVFYQGPSAFGYFVCINKDGTILRLPVALPAALGATPAFLSVAYNGAWLPDANLILRSNGLDELNLDYGTLRRTANNGFAVTFANRAELNPNIIAGYGALGNEVIGAPIARPGNSVLYFDQNGVRQQILNAAVIGGVNFNFILGKAFSPLAPSHFYLYAMPNQNNMADTRTAFAKYRSDSVFSVAAVVDDYGADGTVAGATDFIRPAMPLISPDGTKLFYYKFAPQPLPTDFPFIHWIQGVDPITLLKTTRSLTPDEAGASGGPPWDVGLAMPCGPFQWCSSRTGKYVFALFHSGNVGNPPKPYILYDTETPTTHYGELADITGFNPLLYDIYSQLYSCFDDDDNLWILLPDATLPHLWLIKFTIAGGLLTQSLRVQFETFDGGNSSLMSGIVFVLGSAPRPPSGETIVGLPYPYYAWGENMGPKT